MIRKRTSAIPVSVMYALSAFIALAPSAFLWVKMMGRHFAGGTKQFVATGMSVQIVGLVSFVIAASVCYASAGLRDRARNDAFDYQGTSIPQRLRVRLPQHSLKRLGHFYLLLAAGGCVILVIERFALM